MRFYFFTSIILAAIVAAIPTRMAFDHNPQGEFCDLIAYDTAQPKEGRENYVKEGADYVPYDVTLHPNIDKLYIVYLGKNIKDANWTHRGEPCRLTINLFRFYGVFFLIVMTPVCVAFLLNLIIKGRKS